MIRRLWIVACVLVPLLVLAVPATALAAIWVGGDRLANTAFLLFFCAIPTVGIFAMWTSDFRPAPNLPRGLRRELAAEKVRIRLDAAIAEAEREAGDRMTADDPAITRMRARAQADQPQPAVCRSCKSAIEDGDLCIECWRDDRALAIERNREWWEE